MFNTVFYVACFEQASNQLLMYRSTLKQTITINNLIVLIEYKISCALEREIGIFEQKKGDIKEDYFS